MLRDTPQIGPEKGTPPIASSSKEAALKTPSTSKLKEDAYTSASQLRDKKTEPKRNEKKSESMSESKDVEGDSNRKSQEPLSKAKK